MAYRETFFKEKLKQLGFKYENNPALLDAMHYAYYMGISRAIEQPDQSKRLYNQVHEVHELDYN